MFDANRAQLSNKDQFQPLYVRNQDLDSLQQALDRGDVQSDTLLILMDHPTGPLTFVTKHLAYHHIAQGELSGEPWMVSF